MFKYIVCVAILSVAVEAGLLGRQALYDAPIETEVHHFKEHSEDLSSAVSHQSLTTIHGGSTKTTKVIKKVLEPIRLHEERLYTAPLIKKEFIHPITTIEEHVAEHIAEIPTAVSHQSSTIVHGGAEKTRTLIKKGYKTYSTPIETEFIHETPIVTKLFKTYKAPVLHEIPVITKEIRHELPALHTYPTYVGVEHPVVTKVSEHHITNIPTAVSHQTSTIVHGGHEKVTATEVVGVPAPVYGAPF